MSKAFTTAQNKKKNGVETMKVLVPVLFFLLVVICVLFGLQSVSGSSNQERLNMMEQAVRRSAVQCYAIEGQYPQDIAYLQENYGLLIDENAYIYHYEADAANLMPSIRVFEK